MDKHRGCLPYKMLGTIFEVDEGRTSTNGPEDKKTMHKALHPRNDVDRLEFWDTNRWRKWTCWIVDFAVPADHRVKIKGNEKERLLLGPWQKTKKKLWNMKVMVIPIVVGALGMVPKGLVSWQGELEIRGRAETI